MPSRDVVYRAINSERLYQNVVWGNTASDNKPGNGARTIDEFALYISGYTNELVKVCSKTGDPSAKLEIVRKIAALATACMEQHGAPERIVNIVTGPIK